MSGVPGVPVNLNLPVNFKLNNARHVARPPRAAGAQALTRTEPVAGHSNRDSLRI
jgi:hypothetical protein